MNPGVRIVDRHRHGARLSFQSAGPEALTGALRRMLNDGVPVIEFHREARKLEDAFVDLLKKG